jgi:hypothetical protein
MQTLRMEKPEEAKFNLAKDKKSGIRRTSTIGPTTSITCSITSTTFFHVFMVSIASSARSRSFDIAIWLSTTGPTLAGVSQSIGRPPVGERGTVPAMDCMFSLLDWAVKCDSATGKSRSEMVGSGMLTADIGEELAFADAVIVNESVTGPAECLECSCVLSKVISSPTSTALS